jgi:hypothetical protein
MVGNVNKSVSAGDNAYDAVMTGFLNSSNMTKQGLLVNLRDTGGIDLSKPWWDQNLLKETSIMNKTYFAAGDVTITTNDGTWTLMFNKSIQEDLNLPNIYELVKSGEWTIDKMAELGKGATEDLNGDGVIDHTDKVAFATTGDSAQGLFFSTGNRLTIKDASDLPIFALSGDKLMTNLDKIYNLMRSSDNFTMLSNDYASVNPLTHLIVQAAFEENRALFYAEVMQCVGRIRQMETEFGIIPMPKADAAQEQYRTTVHQTASAAISIPRGGEDDERTGTIIEALAYGGYKFITPAYYDIALKSKYARDDESSEMLDIILAGRTADLGYIDGYGAFLPSSIQSSIVSRQNNFASTIDKAQGRIENDISKAIQKYEDLP